MKARLITPYWEWLQRVSLLENSRVESLHTLFRSALKMKQNLTMNASIYVSEFFSYLMCLCECTKYKRSLSNTQLFSLYFPIWLSILFFKPFRRARKKQFPHPPSSLFLFPLTQEGALVNLLGPLCYIQCNLVQLTCELRLSSLWGKIYPHTISTFPKALLLFVKL